MQSREKEICALHGGIISLFGRTLDSKQSAKRKTEPFPYHLISVEESLTIFSCYTRVVTHDWNLLAPTRHCM